MGILYQDVFGLKYNGKKVGLPVVEWNCANGKHAGYVHIIFGNPEFYFYRKLDVGNNHTRKTIAFLFQFLKYFTIKHNCVIPIMGGYNSVEFGHAICLVADKTKLSYYDSSFVEKYPFALEEYRRHANNNGYSVQNCSNYSFQTVKAPSKQGRGMLDFEDTCQAWSYFIYESALILPYCFNDTFQHLDQYLGIPLHSISRTAGPFMAQYQNHIKHLYTHSTTTKYVEHF